MHENYVYGGYELCLASAKAKRITKLFALESMLASKSNFAFDAASDFRSLLSLALSSISSLPPFVGALAFDPVAHVNGSNERLDRRESALLIDCRCTQHAKIVSTAGANCPFSCQRRSTGAEHIAAPDSPSRPFRSAGERNKNTIISTFSVPLAPFRSTSSRMKCHVLRFPAHRKPFFQWLCSFHALL